MVGREQDKDPGAVLVMCNGVLIAGIIRAAQRVYTSEKDHDGEHIED